jgi:hypothetical protein
MVNLALKAAFNCGLFAALSWVFGEMPPTWTYALIVVLTETGD